MNYAAREDTVMEDSATMRSHDLLIQELRTRSVTRETLFDYIQENFRESKLETPSFEQIAQSLCTSTRTLSRRLKGAGINYREVLSEFQRETAERLLKNSSYTIHDVANKMGYRDRSNFTKAFKGWTGITPHSFRTAYLSRKTDHEDRCNKVFLIASEG